MQNRFHPGTTQKTVRRSRLLEPYLNLIKVLGFINQRVQDYVITSPSAPSWLARSFGTVHGTLTRWYYASDLCHEPEGPRHFLALLLAPGNVCLDIGASHGITTRIARVAVGPLGSVYAFEPQQAVFEKLLRTKERFGWDNVVLVQCLVGETVGERVLYEHPSNSQISSLSAMWNQCAGTAVTYPMTTLDTWAAGNALERADLVKVDVEGAELQVIRGGTDFLRRSQPALLLEINNRTRRERLFGYSIDDLLSELRALGYAAFYALRPRGLALFQNEAQLLDSDRDMLATANAALNGLPWEPC
jgi:FkbM family methyltransferase